MLVGIVLLGLVAFLVNLISPRQAATSDPQPAPARGDFRLLAVAGVTERGLEMWRPDGTALVVGKFKEPDLLVCDIAAS